MALGVLLALVAGAWHGALMTYPTNDNFLHLALAQQLLAGDWPIADFFDHGLTLQFTLSALAQGVAGHRLLSEALVVALAWMVSTFLAFALVRRLTGSTAGAVVAAVLLIVSGPRGYSYPKVIVYVVAAWLFWLYVWRPGPRRIVLFGAWAAVAFYWRPDHGLYVSAGIALAALAAHGLRPIALTRTALAAAVVLAAVAPFFIAMQMTIGLPEYVRAALTQAEWEHQGSHRLPSWPLRTLDDVIRIAPAVEHAPRIALRWDPDSTAADRDAVVTRYGLTRDGDAGPLLQHVRLSAASLADLRALINEPVVADTAGVDRSTATIPDAQWPQWERLRLEHRWLRLRVLGGLEEYTRAGEAVAGLFFALPLLAAVIAVPLRRHFTAPAPAGALLAFAAFALLVTFGLLRRPYEIRAVDGVALPAILLGVSAALLWRAGPKLGSARRWLFAGGAVVLALLLVKGVSQSGQFGGRLPRLGLGDGLVARADARVSAMAARLLPSPPLDAFASGPRPAPVSLAAYVVACVPASERLLVLWFAPEIYYYAGRAMAQRHLVFVPGWAALAHEQQLTLQKIQQAAPSVVLASSSLDGLTRTAFPGVVDYVHAHYTQAAALSDDDREYMILARRDLPVVRGYGDEGWPCYQ